MPKKSNRTTTKKPSKRSPSKETPSQEEDPWKGRPLPEKTLFREALATLGRLTRLEQGYLALFALAMFLFPIGINGFQMRMVSGSSNGLATLYVVIKFAQWANDGLRELFLVRIGRVAETGFINREVARYATFDKASTYRHPPENTLERHLTSAASSVNRMIEWGMQSGTGTLGQVIACVVLLFGLDIQWYDGIAFIIFPALYKFVLVPLQGRLTDEMKAHQDKCQASSHRIPFVAHEFKNKEIEPKEFADVLTKPVIYDSEKVRPLFTYTFSSIELSMVLIAGFYALILPTDSDFAIRNVLLNTVSVAINNIAQFGTQYKRYCASYDDYRRLFEDKDIVVEKPIPKAELPEILVIKSIRLRRGKYTVQCPDAITIRQGDRIRIKGPSGSGKSTFLDGVMGFISGIRLNTGKNIRAYSHRMVCHLQNAQSIALGSISIKEVFRSVDTGAIRRVLDIVFDAEELDEILGNLSSTDPYGVHINDRMSGGQKTRFILARTIFKAIQKGAKMVFLDEPEQGQDPDLQITTFKAINEFASSIGMTVVWITHLREEPLLETEIQFNTRIELQRGGQMTVESL